MQWLLEELVHLKRIIGGDLSDPGRELLVACYCVTLMPTRNGLEATLYSRGHIPLTRGGLKT